MDTDFDDLIDQVFAGRLLVSVKEAEAAGLGGHSSIYDQISSGDLDAVKDGRSLRIKVSSIRRRLASLPKAIVRPGHTPKSSASHTAKPVPRSKKRAAGQGGHPPADYKL